MLGPPMGTSRRYADYYDRKSAEKLAAMPSPPCTLPQQAFGPSPIEWVQQGETRPCVWVWISWPDRVAERVPAVAVGWNDRVVVVEWDTDRGTRNVVVWRNAVTKRITPSRVR